MTLMGLGCSMWEVRVVSSATPLGLLGGVWAYVTLARSGARTATMATLRATFALLIFSPMMWAVVPTPDESVATVQSAKSAELCREPGHVSPLAVLAPGIIFAPIDSGSHILVHTGLSVVGAPYHRNNRGNRAVIDGFAAEGNDAQRIVASTGARYVSICPGQAQAEALTARNPNGLASQILSGHPPAWLKRIEIPGTPYLVYALNAI